MMQLEDDGYSPPDEEELAKAIDEYGPKFTAKCLRLAWGNNLPFRTCVRIRLEAVRPASRTNQLQAEVARRRNRV